MSNIFKNEQEKLQFRAESNNLLKKEKLLFSLEFVALFLVKLMIIVFNYNQRPEMS